ncbi:MULTISPECIES: hypothetical protein [Sphingobacterium]|uniref:hypothetical protein n=1 Tax=Sphingobacterium TaxID=28453 RepID=UPI00257B0420|nr:MULTISPECIES: hypothetical protein [Sphingobacterium]
MMKQFLFFILCLLTLKAIADDTKKQEVDSILAKAREFHIAVEVVPQLEFAIKGLELANKYKYDEGQSKAHFWAADALLNIGLFKEAFKHLTSIETTRYYAKKILMQSETHRLKGKGYLALGLYHQATQEFHFQLACAKKLDAEQQKRSAIYAYSNLSSVYQRLDKRDSLLKYIELQLDGLKGFDEKENASLYVEVYADLGNFYTKKGDLTKAQHYLDKSLALVEKYKVLVFFNTMSYLTNLEQAKGNYKKAATFSEKGLENMQKVGNWDAVCRRYKSLAYFYRFYNLGSQKADEYDLAYRLLNDSLEKENKLVMDAVMIQLKKSKDKEAANKVSKSVTVSLVILAVLIIAIAFSVWRVRHNRKLLGQKEEALHETETLNKELTEQIGENKFINLIDLAKSNNPEFLTLFAELYPQFIQTLKTFDPKIRTTELEFCAMAFLNFSTKNIAEYTFVTVRAVQVRKNRLRKKLEIPSEADFNTWMRGLAEKEEC